jgi:hypothetical protein
MIRISTAKARGGRPRSPALSTRRYLDATRGIPGAEHLVRLGPQRRRAARAPGRAAGILSKTAARADVPDAPVRVVPERSVAHRENRGKRISTSGAVPALSVRGPLPAGLPADRTDRRLFVRQVEKPDQGPGQGVGSREAGSALDLLPRCATEFAGPIPLDLALDHLDNYRSIASTSGRRRDRRPDERSSSSGPVRPGHSAEQHSASTGI